MWVYGKKGERSEGFDRPFWEKIRGPSFGYDRSDSIVRKVKESGMIEAILL